MKHKRSHDYNEWKDETINNKNCIKHQILLQTATIIPVLIQIATEKQSTVYMLSSSKPNWYSLTLVNACGARIDERYT